MLWRIQTALVEANKFCLKDYSRAAMSLSSVAYEFLLEEVGPEEAQRVILGIYMETHCCPVKNGVNFETC